MGNLPVNSHRRVMEKLLIAGQTRKIGAGHGARAPFYTRPA
jgi:hypothetical protein